MPLTNHVNQMSPSSQTPDQEPKSTPPPPPPPPPSCPPYNSPPYNNPPTFLNLPRTIRDQIYHSALHDSAPQSPDPDFDLTTPPHVPLADLGLLRASRQLHDEASAVLYGTVHLGSDARAARRYLEFMGEARRRQIRHLTVFYKCHGGEEWRLEHNWIPVFDLLWESWACVLQVDVDFASFGGCPERDGAVVAERTCRFEWDEGNDCFWRGLGSFRTAREIRFLNPVPEYFVRQQAGELGWRVDGHAIEDAPGLPLSPFVGRLVNPTYPDEANRVCERNGLADQGLRLTDKPTTSKLNETQTVRPSRNDTGSRTHFFDLPLEIRTMIYDEVYRDWEFKAYWPAQPARWSPGLGLVLVCKQIWEEASLYMAKTVRVPGGSPLRGIERVGSRITSTRAVDLHFSCFCPSGPKHLRLNNETIFAREDPVWRYAPGPLAHRYPNRGLMWSYEHEWAEVMKQIRSHPNIREVSATFISCCRQPATYDSWMPHRTPGYADSLRSFCLTLEGQFISLLLAACHGFDVVTLRGNVPPSLAVRLEEVGTDSDLSLQAISKQMAAFIKGVEKETAERDANGLDPTWAKQTPYPPLRYHPAKNPPPHFALERTRPGTPTWSWLEERNKGTGIATGMELVSGPVFAGSWKVVSEVFDFDNFVVNKDDP